MNLIPLPAFQDKDPLTPHDRRRSPMWEPGGAQPVLARLQREVLQLKPILVTHHDPAHTAGPLTAFAALRYSKNDFQ